LILAPGLSGCRPKHSNGFSGSARSAGLTVKCAARDFHPLVRSAMAVSGTEGGPVMAVKPLIPILTRSARPSSKIVVNWRWVLAPLSEPRPKRVLCCDASGSHIAEWPDEWDIEDVNQVPW